jgi:hypothetical protein
MYFQESMIFLQAKDVQAMLELDDEAIASLSEAKVLLALKLADGELTFPDFQFRHGKFHPELIVSFQRFNAKHTGWDVAIWFHEWNENLQDFPVHIIEKPGGLKRIRLAIEVEQAIATL